MLPARWTPVVSWESIWIHFFCDQFQSARVGGVEFTFAERLDDFIVVISI